MALSRYSEVANRGLTDGLKFWHIRYQEFLTLGEIEYRRILAADQLILVRETPEAAIEQWRQVMEKARAL